MELADTCSVLTCILRDSASVKGHGFHGLLPLNYLTSSQQNAPSLSKFDTKGGFYVRGYTESLTILYLL